MTQKPYNKAIFLGKVFTYKVSSLAKKNILTHVCALFITWLNNALKYQSHAISHINNSKIRLYGLNYTKFWIRNLILKTTSIGWINGMSTYRAVPYILDSAWRWPFTDTSFSSLSFSPSFFPFPFFSSSSLLLPEYVSFYPIYLLAVFPFFLVASSMGPILWQNCFSRVKYIYQFSINLSWFD